MFPSDFSIQSLKTFGLFVSAATLGVGTASTTIGRRYCSTSKYSRGFGAATLLTGALAANVPNESLKTALFVTSLFFTFLTACTAYKYRCWTNENKVGSKSLNLLQQFLRDHSYWYIETRSHKLCQRTIEHHIKTGSTDYKKSAFWEKLLELQNKHTEDHGANKGQISHELDMLYRCICLTDDNKTTELHEKQQKSLKSESVPKLSEAEEAYLKTAQSKRIIEVITSFEEIRNPIEQYYRDCLNAAYLNMEKMALQKCMFKLE